MPGHCAIFYWWQNWTRFFCVCASSSWKTHRCHRTPLFKHIIAHTISASTRNFYCHRPNWNVQASNENLLSPAGSSMLYDLIIENTCWFLPMLGVGASHWWHHSNQSADGKIRKNRSSVEINYAAPGRRKSTWNYFIGIVRLSCKFTFHRWRITWHYFLCSRFMKL